MLRMASSSVGGTPASPELETCCGTISAEGAEGHLASWAVAPTTELVSRKPRSVVAWDLGVWRLEQTVAMLE